MKTTKKNYVKDFATKRSKSINLRYKNILHPGRMCKMIFFLSHFSRFV